MDETAGSPAVAAMTQAKVLASRASEREQRLINALVTRYTDAPKTERAALDRAYAVAMAEATRRFPDDTEIAVLSMDAIMNLLP